MRSAMQPPPGVHFQGYSLQMPPPHQVATSRGRGGVVAAAAPPMVTSPGGSQAAAVRVRTASPGARQFVTAQVVAGGSSSSSALPGVTAVAASPGVPGMGQTHINPQQGGMVRHASAAAIVGEPQVTWPISARATLQQPVSARNSQQHHGDSARQSSPGPPMRASQSMFPGVPANMVGTGTPMMPLSHSAAALLGNVTPAAPVASVAATPPASSPLPQAPIVATSASKAPAHPTQRILAPPPRCLVATADAAQQQPPPMAQPQLEETTFSPSRPLPSQQYSAMAVSSAPQPSAAMSAVPLQEQRPASEAPLSDRSAPTCHQTMSRDDSLLSGGADTEATVMPVRGCDAPLVDSTFAREQASASSMARAALAAGVAGASSARLPQHTAHRAQMRLPKTRDQPPNRGRNTAPRVPSPRRAGEVASARPASSSRSRAAIDAANQAVHDAHHLQGSHSTASLADRWSARLSPREERAFAGASNGTPARRSASQADLRQEAGNSVMPRRGGAGARTAALAASDAEVAMELRNLRGELESLASENMRLQGKLMKARNLVVLLQKQAEEARGERDKEYERAEALQLQLQHTQMRLQRETLRANALEKKRLAAAAVHDAPTSFIAAEAAAPLAMEPSPTMQVQPEELPRSGEVSIATDPTAAEMGHQLPTPPVAEDMDAAVGAEFGGIPADKAEAPDPSVQLDTGPGLEKSWEFVVQGQLDAESQLDFAPKLISCFPDNAVEKAWSRGVASVCSRGRRLDSSVPNQDDFLLARHALARSGHISLFGVFDGHGPDGHHCAAFARSALPEHLFGQQSLLLRPEVTLRQAFEQTQKALLQQTFDTEHSGTTAALALILHVPATPASSSTAEAATASAPEGANAPSPGGLAASDGGSSSASVQESWLIVAHVGDSRVVLASRRDEDSPSFSVTALTRDHRPDDSEEAERVRHQGGDIRALPNNPAAVRVFAAGGEQPISALTRTLGLACAVDICGVSAEPEVAAYRLRPGTDVLLMLGTDGLFEFVSNSHAAGQVLQRGVSAPVLEELCSESRRQWQQTSCNQTVDDITAIAVSLSFCEASPSASFA
eukprot:TRINITY_DN35152_c0_g1_i1.p1 TRINITY_DN35152_c0_g1~~TRINITY_DN35152_c0_g1_i1.p1  ORF type:complete len:1075 (-),score=224.73 TRINITY_DN35152_c0_g1_i1:62-3286(-)